MTIGELSRRTGVPIRLLWEYERLGLVYTPSRSEGKYRLFDETALWCGRQVQRARALGLTIKEILEVCDAYQGGGGLFAVLLTEQLDAARARVDERMAELQAQRAQIAVARPARRLDGEEREAFFEFLGRDEIKIKGHRVWLEDVLLPYRAGYVIEQLRLMLPTLKPRALEAVIRYYELHQERVDRYLDAAEAWAHEARHRQRGSRTRCWSGSSSASRRCANV